MSLMAAFELKLFQNGTQMKIAQRKLNKNEILSLEFSVFEPQTAPNRPFLNLLS
jgi:hypothetical protein